MGEISIRKVGIIDAKLVDNLRDLVGKITLDEQSRSYITEMIDAIEIIAKKDTISNDRAEFLIKQASDDYPIIIRDLLDDGQIINLSAVLLIRRLTYAICVHSNLINYTDDVIVIRERSKSTRIIKSVIEDLSLLAKGSDIRKTGSI